MSLSAPDQAGTSEATKAGSSALPLLLAGPILRRATGNELVIWLVCTDPVPLRLCCYWSGERHLDMEFPPDHPGHLRIGERAHLQLLALRPPAPLPTDRWIEYDIALLTDSGEVWLSEVFPDLKYPYEERMRFVIKTHIDELLHGSCRKPHHDSGDGLVLVDDLLAQAHGVRTDPSGLMDWETLSDLQQELIEEPTVLLVSGAPIFGVKLIEVVQQVFTWFGHALTVDAENWMAHPGSANVILNIFCHRKTPHNFVILSGDVHYSFVYDVEVRHYQGGPAIWQITCSGYKNEFPARLLRLFDRLNRWLFASHSPLNWLTRRRAFRIRQRRPSQHKGRYRHQRLANGSGVGRLRLDPRGAPISIEMVWINGERLRFTEGRSTDWVH